MVKFLSFISLSCLIAGSVFFSAHSTTYDATSNYQSRLTPAAENDLPRIQRVQQRKNVRLYKVNKQMQATRLLFTAKKGKTAGCHNILVKSRVHRMNQTGYAYCTAYAKKNCASDSIISAIRKKDANPTTQLTQGYSWFLQSDHKRGAKLKSWSCKD